MRFASFERYILPRCHDSLIFSLGCLEALNSLASSLETPTVLIFEGMQEAYPGRLGGLHKRHKSIFEYRLSTKLRPTSYLERVQSLGRRMDLFEAHLQTLRNRGAYFPFQHFFKSLSARFLNSKKKRASEAAVSAGMINTFVGTAFDPHTHLIAAAPQDEAQVRSQSRTQSAPVVGIGVLLEKFPFGWAITHVDRGGPASQAGVLPGDLLVRIDHESTMKMNLATVAAKISGHTCAAHRLTLDRAGKKLEVSVTNFSHTPTVVEFRVLHEAGRIGHLKIRTFNEARLPRHANDLLRMLDPFVDAWVLDLRGNGGGNLQDGISVASMFIGKEEIARVVSDDGVIQRKFGKFDPVSQKPLVVLVDHESASASELVSQSLQDHQRAWIVGARTYGKGTGQRVVPLPGQVQMATTAFTFFGPRKITPQLRGVLPDFDVPHRLDQPEADLDAAREESYYPRPREIESDAWVHPRPQDLSWMRSCIEAQGRAQDVFSSLLKNRNIADYRMLVAIDVLRCQYWLQDAKRI